MVFKSSINLKNLGDLTEQQKQMSCWAPGTISGSRVARVMLEPRQVLAEWLNDTPTLIENNPIVKEKMEIGTYMEPVIVELAKQKLGLDIVIDKNTYQYNDKPFYFNIDGVSSDGSVIYEIKNTETTSIEVLVERYKYQAIWYKLMTGCDKVIFLFFIRGYKLRKVEFEPTQAEMFEVLNNCEKIIEAYNVGTADAYNMITWAPEETQENGNTKPIAITDEVAKQKLADLIAMQEDAAQLEKMIKELKEYFGEAIGDSGSYIDETTGNKVSVVCSTRKGGVDVEETLKNNPGVIIAYKKDYTSRTIRVTKGKGEK